MIPRKHCFFYTISCHHFSLETLILCLQKIYSFNSRELFFNFSGASFRDFAPIVPNLGLFDNADDTLNHILVKKKEI